MSGFDTNNDSTLGCFRVCHRAARIVHKEVTRQNQVFSCERELTHKHYARWEYCSKETGEFGGTERRLKMKQRSQGRTIWSVRNWKSLLLVGSVVFASGLFFAFSSLQMRSPRHALLGFAMVGVSPWLLYPAYRPLLDENGRFYPLPARWRTLLLWCVAAVGAVLFATAVILGYWLHALVGVIFLIFAASMAGQPSARGVVFPTRVRGTTDLRPGPRENGEQ
jgi:hypothetical protein